MSVKKALITGVTGQDGGYLAESLARKGYEIHGVTRCKKTLAPHLTELTNTKQLSIHVNDLSDSSSVQSMIESIQPNEVYNLAAQSHVGQSFEKPLNTFDITAMGPLRLLEAIRRSEVRCKFYQASSSEQFGRTPESPQHELTRFHPRSPYGCAKACAHYITQNYREAYGMFAVSGILFNHESVRRNEAFVTRKITRAVARIAVGLQNELVLGSTVAQRDWGYAPDYVEAMWMMLQNERPNDYVVGTGKLHSVQDFVNEAFYVVDMDPTDFVVQDPQFMRPSEVDTLRADPQKIYDELGWQPSVGFQSIVRLMVEHDIELALREKDVL